MFAYIREIQVEFVRAYTYGLMQVFLYCFTLVIAKTDTHTKSIDVLEQGRIDLSSTPHHKKTNRDTEQIPSSSPVILTSAIPTGKRRKRREIVKISKIGIKSEGNKVM